MRISDTFDRESALRYAPRLLMDKREPFFPVRIGVTAFEAEGDSLSFRRRIAFTDPKVQSVLEYAIYYDYDIQHLYDLEHVWIYIGKEGEIVDAEASFHGKYLKALRSDRSNINHGRVTLYVQPGKHAMAPLAERFERLPDFERCTMEEAGADGVIYGDMFAGLIRKDHETDRRVREHLQKFRFRPSREYEEFRWEKEAERFVPWERLYAEIPERMRKELALIRGW
ncbi:hypothetical protein LBW89_11515 [Paenibacillus sp. alder61]|uniref:Uncharacterized protein n=1 Tax=Paenibacillus faecis TaxID=862114 RepID=A0A5D0CU19_9BACL|nr:MULTISPECIES: hypothetical protein [Paenibacillus]MCA1293643.1 hypothetical protein [Paenibacillus sp. alder61]TYA12754.1 hypothetical protein FRY98_08570 [Paenibacillus faecis]